MSGENTFDYIQFTANGFLTYVTIRPELTGLDAVQVYNDIAVTWLEPFNVPGHTGNYTLLGSTLYLNYEPHESFPAYSLTGEYSASAIVIDGLDGETWEYEPLPLP
jgi:hypothetical protein